MNDETTPEIGPSERMELQRLGLSDLDNPAESLQDARQFLPMLHAEVEKARRSG